jgi:hypothetical protein
MGDDDSFKPEALAEFIQFLEENRSYNYILRSYVIEHADKKVEIFKYFPQTTVLKEVIESACFFFKRSVSIAGFTIARKRALELATDEFDGTLLYQLHLVLSIAYFEDTIFCDITVARVTQSFRKIILLSELPIRNQSLHLVKYLRKIPYVLLKVFLRFLRILIMCMALILPH